MSDSNTFVLYNESERTALYDHINEIEIDGKTEVTFKKVSNNRTSLQNRSLHLYCDQIALDMNDAGIGQRKFFDLMKPGFDLPVSKLSIKELFRNVGFAIYGAKSTSDLKTDEIHEVWQVVNQRIMEITGVSRPWPSLESMDYESQGLVK